jgi:lipopolysaccharide/colanic/teichoic acid biosynthesis glycosyltransferase
VALFLSVLFFPVGLLISVLIMKGSRGGVLFFQDRMGRGGRVFRIAKFRTMHENTATASGITVADDSRITRVGVFLRRYRLDELPQLYNVLRGDMSLVGPRPDLPKYYSLDDPRCLCVLLVRPGITCRASLLYRDEERLLALSENPEETYERVVFPAKLGLNCQYVQSLSLFEDVRLVAETVAVVFPRRRDRVRQGATS